ncbi:BTAD domain-containing putative transcriptional regulator [Nocardioides marmoribigeumensis]|uniref:DNA-binding SARP family transcriptional activator n=1 Tax=Nocardioides marmoribigeumensis TaxID=433649 RepID=A0ABU2BT53_9ACTN|nr:BTAD domain-containing putative transcriptional regulator [Nocardioides marmoribigeumensis]MDR7361816.1 DNA-binding SARP family transcriptional activator [Nocardioides marmoribigeumensis]
MRARVLGELEVEVGTEVLDLGGPKPRALVGLMLAAGGRPVPFEHLVDQIWGDAPPARVEASLQSYVARLRRVLEPGRDARSPAQVLRTHAGGYSLHVDDRAVDAREFTRLLGEARDGAADQLGLLTEALAPWRGTAYLGLGCPSLDAEATRLEELRMGAVERLWRLRLDRGEHTEAVAELEQLVREHPLREQLWGLLALALYRSARQGDALAALRRARDHLADELGVDPGPDLRALETAVLRQDPSLDRSLDPAVGPAGGSAVAPPVVLAGTDQPDLPGLPAVFGRGPALAEASRLVDDVAAGRGRVLLVSGQPGLGKTRFAEAVVGTAAAAGFRVGRGGWEPEGGPPLWGWTRALRQLLGDASILEGEQTDASSASFRQADALLGALRTGPPSVVVLDDLHWADAESLRLLRRVATGIADVPLLLVPATRDAPAEVGPVLAETLAQLARLGAHRVDLAGLEARDVRDWVSFHHGLAVSEAVADRIIERTGGNPFFVTELVRLLVAEGVLNDPSARSWDSVPTGVRDVVRHRLAQVDPPAAAVAGTAAVAGREFDVAVVATAAGLGLDEVLEHLEPLLMMGLLDEVGPGRARFSHALVRDAVHESLSPAVRARTHAAVAAAIEAHHLGRVHEHSAELAEHYRLAGPAHARSAWLFAVAGAEDAAARSAHDEALRLSVTAAELQAGDPEAGAVERERVALARARALVWLSRPVEAWAPAAEAATSALGRGDADAAAAALLVVTENLVWGWRGYPDWDEDALLLWQAVRERVADPVTHAHLTAALAFEHFLVPGRAEQSTRLAEEALEEVRRSTADKRHRLAVLQLATSALMRPETLVRRAALLDEAVELATARGDHAALAAVLSHRASDRAALGQLDEARSDADRSHELAVRHHHSQTRLVVGWVRAMLLQVDERFEEAEQAIAELESLQATMAMAGQGIELAQLATLRDLQGRMAEVEPALREVAPFHPAFRELHGLSMVATGRLDELRRRLGAYDEQPPIHEDYLWVGLTVVRARVWAALGDPGAVADLRTQLAPYAGWLGGTIAVTFQGSVHQTLGELALVAGDRDAAADHLARAREVHERLGLGLWVARTDALLARLG